MDGDEQQRRLDVDSASPSPVASTSAAAHAEHEQLGRAHHAQHPHQPHAQQQQHQHQHPPPPPPPLWKDGVSYAHAPDLTHYLESTFVPSVVPQPDEYHAKDQARQYLEKLADQVSPGAKLLPFGSMANGFALKNSGTPTLVMYRSDIGAEQKKRLLTRSLQTPETNYYVKMLPRARIPIIKLTLPPTPDVPMGMACDIGFENRLALENTRLLLTYAMIDSRLRTLVLFLKVWTKRRKINNPYRGTNLQRLSTPDGPAVEETIFEGHDISFFDDLDALPSLFQTTNPESSGELLIDFFRYFSKDFNYAHSVVSIRSDKGVLPKVQKGWHTDFEFDPELTVRDQHKLCIEDPFQLDYNVARTVTKDGLYTVSRPRSLATRPFSDGQDSRRLQIRGEFMRAFRILTTPTRSPEGIGAVINSLCEEREDYLLIHPADDPAAQHYNHRLYPGTPAHPQRSPRRRSAPSPRMGPTAYGQGLHHQQPPHLAQSPVLGREHPFWSAMNGGSHGAPNGDGVGRSTNGEVVEQSAGGAGGGGGGVRSAALAEPFHPGGPANSQSHLGRPPHPAAAAASDYSYGVRPPIQHVSTPPTVAGSPPLAPASIDGASTSSRERRQSWDGTSAGAAAAAAGKATSGAALSGGYDLHRFFQNPQQQPSSSSVSEVGGPTSSTMASTASTGAALNGRGPVSLTAPSSPDMISQSAHFAGHPSGQYSHAYAGRSQYRYGAAAGGHSGPYPGASHVGPRLATSVPRNPHTAHHAYTNPYASAAVPYPLSASAAAPAATASGSGYVTPTGYPMNAASPVHGAAAALAAAAAMPPAPKPIFPEEDRERVAMANRISFGSFPEMLPLPSYAHYHASGGSAAYLAGAGGWGSEPYGVSGPMRDRTRTHGPAVGASGPRRSGTGRRSLSSTAENEYSGEEDEDAGDVGEEEVEDGSRHLGAVLEDETASSSAVRRHPFPPQLARDQFSSDFEADRPARIRGRSAPHVRMGPDGRETLLFGAIEVTLPRAEDVEEAELEEEMYDQQLQEEEEAQAVEEAVAGGQAGEGGSGGETTAQEAAPAVEEREVAFLGPTPHANGRGSDDTSDLTSSHASTTRTTAATAEELPAHAVRSIPVLTTQPPTPAKGSPALPNALGLTEAPSSPRRRPASPALGSESPTRSLRSSRPGSPRRSLSNEVDEDDEPALIRGDEDDDATTLANGVSELSLASSSPSSP
ncbi:hypothetical protein C6P46_001306 [Rhodotorula mucilaginosa]|uniref:polynucleotide adenylyltransferase n=1 Tax=Rhodotorula mucilaginosa TaxID=5537 RepID=A0A9P7B2L4_RHOMI|nr:hypothetical protein C6P46_001306 [Rhodotorula mucilaginosa]